MKINTSPNHFLIESDFKVLFKIMKLCLIILFAFVFQIVALNTNAQDAIIELRSSSVTINQLFNEIEKQTDYLVVYSNHEVNTSRKVNLDNTSGKVSEYLTQTFRGTDIKYNFENKYIVLTKETNEKERNIVSLENNVQQQGKTVRGKVSDPNGEPIIGANIMEVGSTNGTITDIDGNYSITIEDDAVLHISYIGYIAQDINTQGRTNIDIILIEDTKSLEEIVVIGYGTQQRKEVAGAVSKVESETITRIASSDFSQGLQGQVAGVNITSSGGTPGANSVIQIRGVGSFRGDMTSPLFVVDGIPYNSMPNFGSDEIESIDILKDAASASIYGTRASNGVILITTKKGKSGELRVTMDAYYGITNIRRNMPLINNTVDWLYVNRVRYMAVGDYNGWTALNDNPRGLHYNTNWQEHFQVDNAPVQNYSVRLSGGSQNLTYNLVSSYFNQKGLWINSDFERFSTRANSQFKNKKFTANTGMAFTISNQNLANTSLISDAVRLRPFKAPVEDIDQDYFIGPGSNAEAVYNIIRRMKEIDRNRRYFGSANIELSYELFDGFQLKANLGGSINTTFRHTYNPSFYLLDPVTGAQLAYSFPIAMLQNRNNLNTQWLTEYMAVYDKTFGGHKLNLLAMYSLENYKRESFSASKRDFLSNDIQVLDGGAIDPTAYGNKYSTSITGSLLRLQYNYQSRYMFSASVRRDGSSKFGHENRYGVFPSIMGAWYISEETFYKNSYINKIISDSKIRFSVGTTGNQFIDDYLYIGLIRQGNDYVLGPSDQSLALGATQTDLVNNLLKWETSISKNLGVDLGFLNGKFSFTADIYYTNKNDMLFPVAIPLSTGSSNSSIDMNVGNMVNKGIELTATYRKARGDFKFNLTGVFSANRNEVTKTNLTSSTIWGGGSHGGDNITVIREGYPAGSFFMIPVHESVLVRTEAELAEYRKLVPNAILGDIRMVDTNNDGVLDNEDRVYQGTGTPEWEGGLTFNGEYKMFDFNIQLYGTYGNMIYNTAKRNAYANKRHIDNMNSYNFAANTNTNIPTPNGNLSHNNYRGRHNYYLEDGSYLRIKNLQIGYNITQNVLNDISINRFRIYLGIDNLFTFTRYTGMDPEISGDGLMTKGVDNSYMPVTTSYRLGLQFDF